MIANQAGKDVEIQIFEKARLIAFDRHPPHHGVVGAELHGGNIESKLILRGRFLHFFPEMAVGGDPASDAEGIEPGQPERGDPFSDETIDDRRLK